MTHTKSPILVRTPLVRFFRLMDLSSSSCTPGHNDVVFRGKNNVSQFSCTSFSWLRDWIVRQQVLTRCEMIGWIQLVMLETASTGTKELFKVSLIHDLEDNIIEWKGGGGGRERGHSIATLKILIIIMWSRQNMSLALCTSFSNVFTATPVSFSSFSMTLTFGMKNDSKVALVQLICIEQKISLFEESLKLPILFQDSGGSSLAMTHNPFLSSF